METNYNSEELNAQIIAKVTEAQEVFNHYKALMDEARTLMEKHIGAYVVIDVAKIPSTNLNTGEVAAKKLGVDPYRDTIGNK
jgi:hypothetical protein